MAWAASTGRPDFAVSAASAVVPHDAGVALAQSDLDAFMRQVLAKRDENWKKLQQYVLDEHEKIDVVGPQLVRIVGSRRDYRWFIKDGYFVRSPVAADGVPVPEAERRQAEDEYLRQAKEREKRAEDRAKQAAEGAQRGRGDPGRGSGTAEPPPRPSTACCRRPASRSSSARRTSCGSSSSKANTRWSAASSSTAATVLRIEYYPARLFSDTPRRGRAADGSGEAAADRRQDLEVERLMNKNSLVTLWVEPGAKQIVKFVFDNVQTDFLPISWLFRLDDFKASMTMSQPFKDVWLPKDVDLLLERDAGGRHVRRPLPPRLRGLQGSDDQRTHHSREPPAMMSVLTLTIALQVLPGPSSGRVLPRPAGSGARPAGPAAAGGRPRPREVVADVLVHGNQIVPDAEVRSLAGIVAGSPFSDALLAEITKRLKDSGKFESIDVVKRFASIEDASRIIIVIIVSEGPVRIVMPARMPAARRRSRSGASSAT